MSIIYSILISKLKKLQIVLCILLKRTTNTFKSGFFSKPLIIRLDHPFCILKGEGGLFRKKVCPWMGERVYKPRALKGQLCCLMGYLGYLLLRGRVDVARQISVLAALFFFFWITYRKLNSKIIEFFVLHFYIKIEYTKRKLKLVVVLKSNLFRYVLHFWKKNHIFSSNIHFEDPFSRLWGAKGKRDNCLLCSRIIYMYPQNLHFLAFSFICAMRTLHNMICVPFTMQNASFTSHRPKG